jgi:hypothetical protein
MSSPDDQYEQQDDFTSDAPIGNASDNNYTSRTGQSQIPVRKDDAPVEDPIDSATADSGETLGMCIPRCSGRLVNA